MTITLHHYSNSSCSQKVRLVLAEKNLDYKSREVDLPSGEQHAPDYVKLNPNHVVPTLEHGGGVYIESALINEYLDDAFPKFPLKSPDAAARHVMRIWTQRCDALHPHVGAITYAIGFRPLQLQQGQKAIDKQLAEIPDLVVREKKRVAIEQGVKSSLFAEAIAKHMTFVGQMQRDLANRSWLAGNEISLADFSALPYVLRLDSLALTPVLEAHPDVMVWFSRMKARPSYEVAITSWVPDAVVSMMRRHGEEVWAEVEPLIVLEKS